MSITLLGSTRMHTAQNALATSTRQMGQALERLSSGKRLNAAADDAAGLAIADRLLRDGTVVAQGVRNASDGLSALRIADGALSQVGRLTGRIAELATQAASGLVGDAQRATIQEEVAQLQSEVDRIAAGTTFNDQPLFGGAPIPVHVGTDAGPDATLMLPSETLSAAALGLGAIDLSTQSGAQAALAAVDAAGAALAERQAAVGASQAQLAAAIDQLRTSREQIAGAEARIRDADVAAESANLIGASIRRRLGVAAAAQANVSARGALALLA